MELDLIQRFIVVFAGLFVAVEPFGVVPAFVSLTKQYTPEEMKKTSLRSSLFGAAVLVFFSLFGIWIFKFLQIDINAFKAAGGLLLLLTALDMLRANEENSCRKCSDEELSEAKEKKDISLVPVAIPMLSGPGAITSVVVFSTDHTQSHLVHFMILALAISVIFVISYFVLRNSVYIKQLLGKSGITVFERIMGLLLAALSIQFILSGVLGVIKIHFSI